MSSNTAEKANRERIFNRVTFYVVGALSALLLGCVVVSWNTRDAMSQLAFLRSQRKAKNPGSAQNLLVDTRPWQTAQELAPMAVSAEEVQFAREAQRLAGDEVDQAFALALHQAQAAAQHRSLKGEALQLAGKVTEMQGVVAASKARVQDLTQRAATQPASNNDDLDLAKAQLGLDADELADAQQDLARALGDDRTQLQQELRAHQEAEKKFEDQAAAQKSSAVATSKNYGTLAKRLNAWFDQRARLTLIEEAGQQAKADAAALIAQHSQTEKQYASGPAALGTADTGTRLKAIQSRSIHSQMLSILDDRIQTEQELGTVYVKWAAQVQLQHRIVLHLLMQSAIWVLAILICGFMLDLLVRHFLIRLKLDRRSQHTLLIVARLTMQVLTALLVLLVVFGPPNQTPTIVGLTTAGLTVVLQDFIISICGWFVLMGKNGIRVGDWVEINSIGGEVTDVGLFRTSMLEIGNWTDHGHPTGRKVTFMNSFAIKGQFFNFSTAGQWMWDELAVTIPPADNNYATIQSIQKAVSEETAKEARMAQQELVKVGHDGLSQFSTEPAINMRPGLNGIDLMVRYITRANNRFEVRNQLYGRVIELLHPAAEKNV